MTSQTHILDQSAIKSLAASNGGEVEISSFRGRNWVARKGAGLATSGYTQGFVISEKLSDTRYVMLGTACNVDEMAAHIIRRANN